MHLLSLVAPLLMAVAGSTLAANASACADPTFSQQPAVPLGPMTIRSLVNDANVCIQVLFPASSGVKWTGIAIASTPYMVGSPVSNAIIFDSTSATTHQVVVAGYDEDNVPAQQDQSSVTMVAGGVTNGVISFTFERSLTAKSEYDVEIVPNKPIYIQWAYASRRWPSEHSDYGAAYVLLGASDATAALADDGTVNTNTPVIAAITFAVIVLLGVLATYVGRQWRFIHMKTVCAPSKQRGAWAYITDAWIDLKVGEVLVVLVYIGGLVAVAVSVQNKFSSLSGGHQLAFISGHIALVALAFLLLPVARGQHWEAIFGSSHERILKMHRWLGILCFVASLIHLIAALINHANIASTESYGVQQVKTLFGLVAFICFLTMTVLSIEPIRRRWYETFYYHHRVASVIGLVFVLLHSKTVQYAMILPLVIYVLSGLFRFRAFFNRFDASIKVHGTNIMLLKLPVTPQTTKWATTANPCAFFWVNVPSVSRLEWHPFSAIVTPDGQSIAFCMKAPTPKGFVAKVVLQAIQATDSCKLSIVVGGPYGKPALDVNNYANLVLIAGGIGVTPMVNLINQFRHSQSKTLLHLVWVVREPEELLAVEDVMFPLPDNVKAAFYVSGATARGSIVNSAGDDVVYAEGKPVLDEIINTSRFTNQSVGVLACGPPGLVHEAQWFSHNCGYDFHKEIFTF
ncbi:unnamed protein product [Aphanomyces euteiches]|uniref:DOMON domain-containing protein n=1 Tax=Aphanomyces euteiches TaxID=100861 RepID=A0A6G0X1J8_9STRA|nr:hypothetical protein Ae201684_009294 [Aphanomyces euteiches]KAH9069889.1 hypothetical protein Ae201684P_002264 [Aphanomyces euteiches]